MFRYFLLPALVFSLIIAVIYSLTSLRKEDASTAPSAATETVSISVMEGVSMVSTKGDEASWLLQSNSIQMLDQMAVMNSIEAEIPGIGMSVVASRGDYDMAKGGLALSGDVEMSGQGFRLSAPSVQLEPDGSGLSSPGRVVIDGVGFRVMGKGMVATGKNVRLLSDVKAVFY